MFSSRPIPPLDFSFLPINDCTSSEDFNSSSSQSSPSPSAFDIKFETPYHDDTYGEQDDLWFSLLGDKNLISNTPDCLPDFDSDEGYIDYSSTHSSGILSPDMDFLGLKSFKEFENGNFNKELQTSNFQNVDFPVKSPQKISDCTTKISGNEEFTFDDCCLLSLPPSPEARNCLDVFFPFPSNSSYLYDQYDQYTSFDRKVDQETSNFDFDVSCFEKSILHDTSNHLDSHKLSDDNTPQNNSSNEVFSNPDLMNMFVSDDHETSDLHNSNSTSFTGRQNEKSRGNFSIHSSTREDHGYAAKLPAASTNRLKKRSLSRAHESFKSSHPTSTKLSSSNTPSSILEMFLTSSRALDPNKGSNAALASEMKRYERMIGSKSDRLLKKLLTTDNEKRRSEARH